MAALASSAHVALLFLAFAPPAMEFALPVWGISVHHGLGGRPLWLVVLEARNSPECHSAATTAGHRLNRVQGGASGHMSLDDHAHAYFSRCNEVALVATYPSCSDGMEAQVVCEAGRSALVEACGGKLSEVTLHGLNKMGGEVQLALRRAAFKFGRIAGLGTPKFDFNSIGMCPEPPPDDAGATAVRASNDVTAPHSRSAAIEGYMMTFTKADTVSESVRALRPGVAALHACAADVAARRGHAPNGSTANIARQFRCSRTGEARLDMLPTRLPMRASVGDAAALPPPPPAVAAIRTTSASSSPRTGPTRRSSRTAAQRSSDTPSPHLLTAAAQSRPWAPVDVDAPEQDDGDMQEAQRVSEADLRAALADDPPAATLAARAAITGFDSTARIASPVTAADMDAIFSSPAPAPSVSPPLPAGAAATAEFDMFGASSVRASATTSPAAVFDVFGATVSASPPVPPARVVSPDASVDAMFSPASTDDVDIFGTPAPSAAPVAAPAAAAVDDMFGMAFGAPAAAAAASTDWFTEPTASPAPAPPAPPPSAVLTITCDAQGTETITIAGKPGEPGAAVVQGSMTLMVHVSLAALPAAARAAGVGASSFPVRVRPSLALSALSLETDTSAAALPLTATTDGSYLITYTLPPHTAALEHEDAVHGRVGILHYTVDASVQPPIIKTLASCRATFAPTSAEPDAPHQQKFLDVQLKTALHASFSHKLTTASFLLQLPPPLHDAVSSGASYAAPQFKPVAQWSAARSQVLWTLSDDASIPEEAAPRASSYLAPGKPAEFKARVPVSAGLVTTEHASRSGVMTVPLQMKATMPDDSMCAFSVEAALDASNEPRLDAACGYILMLQSAAPARARLTSSLRGMWKA